MQTLKMYNRFTFAVPLTVALAIFGALVAGILITTRPTIDATVGNAHIYFTADRGFVFINGCVTVQWHVENNREVYLNGEGKAGTGQQEVCLTEHTQPILWVVFKDGTSQLFSLPIRVLFTSPIDLLLCAWGCLALICGVGLLVSRSHATFLKKCHYLPHSTYSWSALIGFVIISSTLTYYGQSEGSGWLKMTSPVGAIHRANSLIGYGFMWGTDPIHYENFSSLDQIALFNGTSATPDMYFMRAVYTFAASLIVPLVGVFNAFLLVNYLCWAAAAWITWRLTRQLFRDELAALLAVVFVTGGMGMIVHIGDYSAHLMSFTFYYLGILLIYESRVWYEQRPFKTHLALGLFLALACFQYNTGLALAIGYVAVSIWRNRWYHVLVAAFLAFSAQNVWLQFLNFLNRVINHAPGWTNFYAIEQQYLRIALDGWINLLLRQPLGAALVSFLRILSEFILFDSPAVVVLGALALILLPRFKHLPQPIRQDKQPNSLNIAWYLLVFTGIPLIAALVYAPSATARGYLIYGVSLLFYAALAGMLAFYLRHAGIQRMVAAIVLVIVMGSHFAWNTAHLWGNFAPVKSYFLGIGNTVTLFTHIPQIVSLTGQEPTPALFGGQATLEAAGLFIATPTQIVHPSLSYALLARSLFTFYITAMLIMVLQSPRWRVRVSVILLAIVVCSTGLSVVYVRNMPQLGANLLGVSVSSEQQLSYKFVASDQFSALLSTQFTKGDALQLHLRILTDGSMQVRLYIGNRELKVTRDSGTYVWTVNAEEFLDALRQTHQVELEIVPQSDIFLAGWQVNGLQNRVLEVSPTRTARIKVLPSVELRLVGIDGQLKIAGF